MGLRKPVATPLDPQEKGRVEHWRERAVRAEKELAAGHKQAAAVEALCELASDLAPRSYDPAPPVPRPAKKQPGSAQTAVLMLSDMHVGQVVTPDQTLGLGEYNFEIFLRRLARLERSVKSIIQDHTTTKVDEIVVPILGDCLHGNLVHSVEGGQRNTIFQQFFSAGHAVAQFLRNLSAIAPLRIYGVCGNHSRFSFQKHTPTDNTYSNFDQFFMEYTSALLRDVKAISFHLDRQPFARFSVKGFNFLCGHGHTLRGGDKTLGLPAHAIGRNVTVHSQLAFRSGNPLPNYFLFGHLHRPVTIPHTLGEVIINGGWPGLDGYALAEAFNSSLPSQKFFLMHRAFGRSATYDLRLDLGDKVPHHYTLPTEFSCE